MSQLANQTLQSSKTVSGTLAMTVGGVLNTDYKNTLFSPIGIDIKGVAKWRSNASGNLLSEYTLTYSTSVGNGVGAKAVSRVVLTMPENVTENGATVVRNLVADVKFSSYTSNTNVQRQALLVALASAMVALQGDISNATSVY